MHCRAGHNQILEFLNHFIGLGKSQSCAFENVLKSTVTFTAIIYQSKKGNCIHDSMLYTQEVTKQGRRTCFDQKKTQQRDDVRVSVFVSQITCCITIYYYIVAS